MPNKHLEPLEQHLLHKLEQFDTTNGLYVAFSGGLDSKVLLHALSCLQKLHLVSNVSAIHVNHGIQAFADQWQKQCQIDCQNYQIDFICSELQLAKKGSNTSEETARNERYRFFESVIKQHQCLLFAHHQQDQAETLLFRLLRGCGLSGASAMPEYRSLGDGSLLRPFLELSRIEIEGYAKSKHLKWIEDPSNLLTDFSRNYLRHQVFPQIKLKWPNYAKTFSRFASISSEQSLLLDEIASEDLNFVLVNNGQLVVEKLQKLSSPRQKNLLHFWGKSQAGTAPSDKEIRSLIEQLDAAQTSGIKVSFAAHFVQSYLGELYLTSKNEVDALNKKVIWENLNQPITLPNGLILSAHQTNDVGLRLPKTTEKVWIDSRQGGERCQPEYRDKSTDLKKIYQELNIPTWQRKWLPIIYYEREIAAIPSVFIAKDFVSANPKESFKIKLETSNS